MLMVFFVWDGSHASISLAATACHLKFFDFTRYSY